MVSVLMLVSLSGITDAIMEVLMSWGYVGMLLAAFLAGSVARLSCWLFRQPD